MRKRHYILSACAIMLLCGLPLHVTAQQSSEEIQQEIQEAIQENSTATDGSLNTMDTAESQAESQELQDLIDQYRNEVPDPSEIEREATETGLEADIEPELPGPHETVRIQITSYLTDLDRAEIFWYVNDTLERSGRGERTHEFTVGSQGSVTTVRVVVRTIEGHRVSRQYTFHPGRVSLLWEAQGYTPPFYKGRTLASPQALVKVVARPELTLASGERLSADELVYTWKRGNQVLEEQSGYGASVAYIRAPKPFGESEITVEVSSLYETYRAEGSIAIPVVDPQVVLYAKDPLAGTQFRTAVRGSAESATSELTLFAAPYFFSLDGLEQEWHVNGAQRGTGPEFTIADTGSNVSVEAVARNTRRTFQSANTTAGVVRVNGGLFSN